MIGVKSFPIVVLASGSGSNLQAILDKLHLRPGREGGDDGSPTGQPVIEVVGVGSDKPGARALERAAAVGVETAIFPATAYDNDRSARDLAMADWVEGLGAELVVLAGYMQLLSSDFVRRFEGRLINVHPSLLPSFAGMDPINQALDHGVTVTGVTVHFVDEGVDTGPIIKQHAVDIPADRSRAGLESAIHAVEHELLPEVIRQIATGEVSLGPGRQVATTGH